jgi:hypothetical protein
VAGMIENMQEMINPQRNYEQDMINQICPNPDEMTYEQLLELGDKIGYVSKGMTEKEIDVLEYIYYIYFRLFQ